MENNKRITLSLVLVAIIAIAAIGVGYAYTAMTTNSGNSASSEYITLTQGGEGAYTFADNQNIYWNTSDYFDSTENKYYTDFSLTGNVDTTTFSGLTVVQLGKSITLTTTQTGGTLADTLDCILTCENFTKRTNEGDIYLIATVNSTDYLFKLTANNTFTRGTVTNGSFTPSSPESHSFPIAKNGTAYYTTEVKVYYAMETTGVIKIEHTKGGEPIGPSTKPIDNATLTFTINANGGNNPDTTPLLGMTVDKVAMTLTVSGATETANITLNPANATNKAIDVSSSNENIATASMNAGNNTVTVTPGETTGTAVITLVSQEGSYTAHITVTVTAAPTP